MNPTKRVTYSIPVYPLVQKFLSAQFDTAPFLLSAYGNPYSGFLYASLDRYIHRDARMPRKYDRLTSTLTVGIPEWVGRGYAGTKLTPQKISVFNDFVRQLFFEKMAEEVSVRMSFGAGMKTSVERFLERYGITEDDLSMDTALRYYARYRRHRLKLIDCCPDIPASTGVILPHERDRTYRQVESGRRQVA